MWAHCKGSMLGLGGPIKIWEEETLARMELFRPVTQEVLSAPPAAPAGAVVRASLPGGCGLAAEAWLGGGAFARRGRAEPRQRRPRQETGAWPRRRRRAIPSQSPS